MNEHFKKQIELYDKSNMKGALKSLPNQIRESFKIIREYDVALNAEINKIIFLGMGGSAIGADCIKSILHPSFEIPITVCRSYEVPNWIDNNTLVIASSYSGNTEETLSAFSKCIEKTSNIFSISTGGELLRLSLDKKISCLKLPKGFQPRAAIGFSIALNLLLLNKIKLISNTFVEEISEHVQDLEDFSISLFKDSNHAYLLAKNLVNRIPIIYGSYGFGEIIGLRFANQLSENSKILSFSNSIPEQNHNEIEGWNKMNNYEKTLCAIFVKDVEDNKQIIKRQNILSQIISNLNIDVFDLKVEHHVKSIRFLKFIHLVDCISYYLAILRNINPSPVETIEEFKSRLS